MTQNPSQGSVPASFEAIRSAVLALINAQSKAERRRVVESQRHLLLIDAADQLLADWLEVSQGHSDYIRLLQEHRSLLARCRREGIEAAFADKVRPSAMPDIPPDLMVRLMSLQSEEELAQLRTCHPELLPILAAMQQAPQQQSAPDPRQELADKLMTFIRAETSGKSKAYLAKHPELLTNEASSVMEMLIQGQDNQDTIRILTEHRDLLIRCRKEGIEAAFADRLRPQESASQTQSRPPQQVIDAVLAFLNAKSWGEKKRIVEQERDLLLSDMGLRVFADLLEHYKENAEAIRRLTDHRHLLIRCQKEGTHAAFAERVRSEGMPISDEVRALSEEIQALTHITDMPWRIELCHRALRLVTCDSNPQFWVALQVSLGNSYVQNPQGSHADNIEQAINCYQQALQVCTPQALPTKWARTMNNLAVAYYERIKGERSENIELAISCYKEALKVQTPQTLPREWATTMNNLALAYSSRIKGEHADNIERAIDCLKEAVSVLTPQALPYEWALTMNNLALAYSDRINGERADNIELAISCLKEALKVRTPQASPRDWAGTMNNLANAYSDRIKGERADNIERAISCYKEALKVQTPQALPYEWADTMNNLANAYSSRIKGERAENIELAISCYKEALKVQTPQALPRKWAGTMNNLATVYKNRIKGERADNIERAISCYKEALKVQTSQALPIELAQTMNNLALAYSSRIKGERADNIERAISCYEEALKIRTAQALPIEWAQTINNLALAYSSRIKGKRADNIERTISCYEEALKVLTPQALPIDWAGTMNNLAAAYYERIKGEHADNIEQAIRCYQEALQVRTPQALPIDWARTMNNLALAYSSRIQGERAENIELAIVSLKQALKVQTPSALPHDCRQSAYWLGRLLYDERRFGEARDAFIMAHEAAEFMRGEATRKETRERLAEENASLYAHLVYCCLAEGDEASAFKYATAGKGRSFVDLLSSVQIDLENVPDEDKPLAEKITQARELKARLDALQGQLLGENVGTSRTGAQNVGATLAVAPLEEKQEMSDAQRLALTVDLQRVRKEEKTLWDEIRQTYPDYFATQSAEPFTLAEAQALASQLDATLVSYYRHDKGWIAFVIRPYVAFDSALKVVELSVTDEELIEWWELFNDKLAKCPPSNLRRLSNLYRALINPLRRHLPLAARGRGDAGARERLPRLVLAPFDLLHLFPLAALRRKVKGQSRYLGEEYSVTITPNLAMLKRVTARAREERSQLCALAYPSVPGSKHYLPNVVPEAKAIAAHFAKQKRQLLVNDKATPQAAILHAPGSHIAHYACHGLFDWSNVENAGLLLAGGRLLNVRQIFNELRLPEAALVTLSACETGRVKLGGGDELAGLVQAFVYAGAPTVIASLWPVNDAATRYLFERFYTYYTKGIAAADALRTAQQELRQRGYEHAYYWAAFQPQGAAYSQLPAVTWPTNIPSATEAIPTIPTKRQAKGADKMNLPAPQEILDEAKKLLRKMELDIEELCDELTAEQRHNLLTILSQLSQQSASVTSNDDLLQLANDILNAIQALPHLHQEFFGNIDPQAEQNNRQLTLQAALEGAKPLPSTRQEEQQVDNIYDLPLKEVCQLLREQEEEHQEEHQEPEEDKG